MLAWFSGEANWWRCGENVTFWVDSLAGVAGVNAVPEYIAVVDDEPAVCKAFERLLRAARFEVSTFASGAAFLFSLSERIPDCVILDLHMPGISGFDVQSRLTSNPEFMTAIVIVTAHDSVELQQRALAGGASSYLRKPVDAAPLLDAVRAAIAERAE
jgi:FixJ family two-component response regulator